MKLPKVPYPSHIWVLHGGNRVMHRLPKHLPAIYAPHPTTPPAPVAWCEGTAAGCTPTPNAAERLRSPDTAGARHGGAPRGSPSTLPAAPLWLSPEWTNRKRSLVRYLLVQPV